MYLGALSCKITIAGKYVLRGVNQIEIKLSVHQLIQTAKIKLPLSVVMRNKDMQERIKIIDKIKEGDSIKLEFGHDGNHRTEFEGFIKRINYSMPLELECEDELYLLRTVTYKESFKKIGLRELLEFVLRGFEQKTDIKYQLYDKMPEMTFSKFQMREANGIDILQELKEKYGLTSYLTTINGVKTLYCGLAYTLEKGRVKISLGRNTIGTPELKYEGITDKKYKIKVVNFNRNGTKNEYEFGDANGEQRTMHFFGDNDKKHLETMANAEMEKFSSKGYRGSFDTFLVPFIEPGTVAEITDPQFPDRKGTQYIGTVTTTFGVSGARRKSEIDIKVRN